MTKLWDEGCFCFASFFDCLYHEASISVCSWERYTKHQQQLPFYTTPFLLILIRPMGMRPHVMLAI